MSDAERIAEWCRETLDLRDVQLPEEYFYQSLPLCVIDAVFSIGVKYESARQVVIRYCKHFKQTRLRTNRETTPSKDDQEPIEQFNEKMSSLGIDMFTNEVFKNRQRTSARNGILKSDAVLRFSTVLKKYNINYFQDIPTAMSNPDFQWEIKSIPGQASGVCMSYFFMLAGSEDFIKPDRMILRFLGNAVQTNITTDRAQFLLSQTCGELKTEYPRLTPRRLDYAIWDYQRKHEKRY